MKFAYADPPYIGQGKRYKEKQEVDHRLLIQRLVSDYPDGWALSCSSPSLYFLLEICPRDVRVLAWVKTFAAFKFGNRPQYAWEPVILRGGRVVGRREFSAVRDWCSTQMTRGLGLVGAKPELFCRWVLNCLGFENGDTIDDIYPGTGIMGRVAAQERMALHDSLG